jgi:transcription antitermination factor NusG
MARHEKSVAAQLEEKRMITFLPLLHQIHRWSDRRVTVEVPMFSCYAFVCIVPSVEERLKVLRTHGVLGLVGSAGHGTPIPEEQIKSVRTVTGKDFSCFPHKFLTVGRRVRIRGGALEGVEGILVQHGKDQSLVVSVEVLQRSVAIQVAGYDIESV